MDKRQKKQAQILQAKESLKEIVPKMGSQIKFTTAIGGYVPGVIYQIIGFGFGPSMKDKLRRGVWTIVDKYNPTKRPKYMWKDELNRLVKEGVIYEDYSNEEKIVNR